MCWAPSSSPTARHALSSLGVEVEVLGKAELRSARHELAAGGLAGLGPAAAARGHALERRRSGDGAGGLRRQGRGVRLGRHLDQARRRHGGHEGRHGRRRRRHRPHARAREPQGEGQCRRRHRPRREHAERHLDAPGRHRSRRCRGRPSRSSTPTPRAASSSPTRSGTRRKSSSRRRSSISRHSPAPSASRSAATMPGLFSNNDELAAQARRRRPRDRRKALAHADGAGLRQADREPLRRHQELRRPPCGLDHRGAVPRAASSTAPPGRISTSPASRSTAPRARPMPAGARASASRCSIASCATTTRQ